MEQALNPASLPPGTHVGPWRLGALLGRGTFGTVYFAEGPGGPAALKLAHAPRDERFAREVALLSRLDHPCIPRLLEHGQWQHYPYLAMERVDGAPLYEWAQATCPTSRQVLRLLAGLARALEAVHSAGGVHRDVKGGNVLVRGKDGRGFLVDFGSCHYEGASKLTWQPYPPGTIAYRAPEAYAYAHERLRSRGSLPPYAPKPADDVFALGVTAWRLVVGDYPPASMAQEAQSPQPAHELNPRCSPELSRLISRMLSPRPDARGTAGELAEALEQAVRREGRAADVPLFRAEEPQLQPEAEQRSSPASDSRAPQRWTSWPWLTAASISAALAGAAVFWVADMHQASSTNEELDEETVGLGGSVLTAPVARDRAPSGLAPIAMDIPARPFPGQTRPDSNGQCLGDRQVAINGGCWWMIGRAEKKCSKELYMYKGGCYAPVLELLRPPTSGPSEAPDAGSR